MTSKADMQKQKRLVELMLASQQPSQQYEDWLHEQHTAYINKHQEVILEALKNTKRGNES